MPQFRWLAPWKTKICTEGVDNTMNTCRRGHWGKIQEPGVFLSSLVSTRAGHATTGSERRQSPRRKSPCPVLFSVSGSFLILRVHHVTWGLKVTIFWRSNWQQSFHQCSYEMEVLKTHLHRLAQAYYQPPLQTTDRTGQCGVLFNPKFITNESEWKTYASIGWFSMRGTEGFNYSPL